MTTNVISKAVITGTAVAAVSLSSYLFTQRPKKDENRHWKLKHLKGNKWRLTNTHSKPVTIWSARLPGVAPYTLQLTWLGENRVLAPKESIEILIHCNSSELALDYTEFNSVEEAQKAYNFHLRNPDVPYGEFCLNSKWEPEPVAPFRQCDIRLWIY